ncbi:hypothetical protein [Bacillus atrophaeus]|uniref:hypothetical protein n=1 Tax=Bacillus atrophaeus TaxID=1452 RepID=UPI00077B272F|nr:hypothetical protein [Bacillus atrophaeus]KXZ16351.1 hypothetical protein AXI57_09200 [Bacillus atrophaeus]MCY8837437.1 hypothetical protein [Bacillus atrophaeus]MEC5220177.1 hypothetical protein [Bacillus atrophaeus]MED4581053.1 hypothetical protein [Bacillus atrophaeus]MED4720812.1 hypothetical protein [Bacillus atrophaeus]
MDKFIDLFSQGWVGSLIGIIGIIFAVYSYSKGKIKRDFAYLLSTRRVVGKDNFAAKDIEINIKGKSIKTLDNTIIKIRNNGNETINGQDISAKDPIRFEVNSGEEIISATILNQTKLTNDISIKHSSNEPNILHIEFDYLDPGDGTAIEVLHTDNKGPHDIKGTIKGIKSFKNYTDNTIKKRSQVFVLWTVVVQTIMIFGLVERDSIEAISRTAQVIHSIIILVIALIILTLQFLMFKDSLKEMKFLRFIKDK